MYAVKYTRCRQDLSLRPAVHSEHSANMMTRDQEDFTSAGVAHVKTHVTFTLARDQYQPADVGCTHESYFNASHLAASV